MALAGVTGVIGTILFTRLRRRCGLECTGLIAYIVEIAFLILAVVSIWTPGSKFDPQFFSRPSLNDSEIRNETTTTVGESVNGSLPGSSNETSREFNLSIILLLVGIILSRVGEFFLNIFSCFHLVQN